MIKVFCFGNTENGELGLGAIEDEHILVPRKQRLPFDRRKYQLLQLSSGRNHTLLLLKNIHLDQNVIFSCGSNDRLQLGRNGSWKKLEQVDGLDQHNIIKLSCGLNHCLALSEAGQLFSWGCNLFGQLGLGSREEYEIAKPSLIKKLASIQIIQISCGGNHCLALSKSGEVYSWGSNAFGQLGLGNSGYCLSMPMLITALKWTPVRQISAGGSHSAILSCTGAIYLWGKNEFGQLGLSDLENRSLPTLQKSLRNQKIVYINLGDEHSAALTLEGGLFTWGAGMYGQLGHGRNMNEVLPRKIFELMGVRIVQVSCGRCHTLAVSKFGRVYSFGLNGSGQLGIGSRCSKFLPVSIRGQWSEFNIKDVILRDEERSVLLVDNPSKEDESAEKKSASTVNKSPSETTENNQTDDVMMEINEIESSEDENNDGDNRSGDDFIIEEPDDDRSREKRSSYSKVSAQQEEEKSSKDKPLFVCADDMVFDKVNQLIQIDEYESDPDSDQEEGPNRLNCFCKEIIAGKGDHSFIITQSFINEHQQKQQQIPKDFRKLNHDEEIIKMNVEIFEKFPSLSKSSSIPLDIVDYIETIFSSIPSLNASFICQSSNTSSNDDDNNTDDNKSKLQKFKDEENISKYYNDELITFNDGLINWKPLFHCFNMVEDAQNERINDLMYQLLVKLLKELPDIELNNENHGKQFENGFAKLLDIEVMRVYQILPLYHMFNSPTFTKQSQQLITEYADSILRLSKRGFSLLKLWWYHMDRRYFKNLIEIFKNSVKLNLLEQFKANEMNQKRSEQQQQQQQSEQSTENVDNMAADNQSDDQPSTSANSNQNGKIKKNSFNKDIHQNLGSCLLMLKHLYSVNKFSSKVSHKDFYITGMSELCDLEYDYFLWKCNHNLQPNQFYFCNFPFIFDSPAKTIILNADSKLQQNTATNVSIRKQILMSVPVDGQIFVNPYIDITVRRDNLLEDTIHQLGLYSKYGEADLKKPLRVLFAGEDAIDAGRAMKKEFFLLLMKELLDQKYGMFIEYDETNTIWFNHAMVNSDDDVMYRLIGMLCGLAIYNQVIVDLPFPLTLYKKILGEKLELNDLAYLDPILTKNLKDILQSTYKPEEFNAIYGDITFVITLTTFGSPVEYELCPDGKQKQLTYENREKYVELYWKYLLITSVTKQFDAFYQGFMKVLDKDVLKIFQAEELMQLVEGEEIIDWSELERSTSYKKPFDHDHPTIRLFWKVFYSFSDDEKRKFLKFLTGSDRIPITGVKSMNIVIQSMNVSENHLPVAHTCFNILDLPLKYESKNCEEIMRRNILKACEYCIEFALV